MEWKEILLLVFIMVILFPADAEGRGILPWPDARQDSGLPNVAIENPSDGQNVQGVVEVRVNAEGNGLQNPYLTIKGENVGTSFQMKDCVVSTPVGAKKESSAEIIRTERMFCTYKWDTNSFKKQKVVLTAEVKDRNGYDKDDVAVQVSGHARAAGRGRAASVAVLFYGGRPSHIQPCEPVA